MEGYSFVFLYRVGIADINYGGHVSNAVVLNFFQDARIAFLKHLGDFSELDIGDSCGIILPEAHVRYHAEMFHGDQLQIGVKSIEVRKSAFVLSYRIEREGALTAEGTTNLVSYDYEKRKPRRLPEQFSEALVRV